MLGAKNVTNSSKIEYIDTSDKTNPPFVNWYEKQMVTGVKDFTKMKNFLTGQKIHCAASYALVAAEMVEAF